MRDRLIEMLNKPSCHSHLLCDKNCKYAHLESCYAERVADHLLKNGVIVPPCKVGDKVYKVGCINCGVLCGVADLGRDKCPYENREVMEGIVLAIKIVKGIRLKVKFDTYMDYYCEDELYYTKEEAEQALKGGAK